MSDIIYNRMYEGLTAYDIKHIKEIRYDTNKLLSYINNLVLLQPNLDYYKGHNDGWDECCAFYEINRNNEETGDI